MKRLLVIIFGLLCLFSVAYAQEDSESIITAEELFADGIIYEEYVSLNETQAIQWDNDSRQITYENSITIDYPEMIESIAFIRELNDGNFYVFTSWSISVENTYLFDLTDNSFSEPPIICEYLVEDTYVYGGWAIIQSRSDGEYRLCEMSTGEMSVPIPTNCEALPQNGGGPQMATRFPSISPNNEWILFNDCLGSRDAPFSLYAYNIDLQQIVELGQTAIHQIGYDVTWLNDHTVIFKFSSYSADGSFAYYISNITEADSLQFIAGQEFVRAPLFLENPPRFLWVEYSDMRSVSNLEHILYEYNLNTREKHELATFPCGEQESAYTFDCPLENRAISYLSGINTRNLDYLIVNHSIYDGDIPTSITILDAQTYEEVYFYKPEGFGFALRWIEADEFPEYETDTLVIARHPVTGWLTPIVQLDYITFEPELSIQSFSNFSMPETMRGFSGDRRYFITETVISETTRKYGIYDVITGDVIPLIDEFDVQTFSIYIDFNYQSDKTLSVSLYKNGERLNLWNVILPQLDGTDT